jgi:hypothetical protein
MWLGNNFLDDRRLKLLPPIFSVRLVVSPKPYGPTMVQVCQFSDVAANIKVSRMADWSFLDTGAGLYTPRDGLKLTA